MKNNSKKKRPAQGQGDQKRIFDDPKKKSSYTITIFLVAVIAILAFVAVKLIMPGSSSENAGSLGSTSDLGSGQNGSAEPSDLAGWEKVGELKGEMQTMTIDPMDPKKIFVGTAGQGLAISNDEGKNWQYFGPDGETILDISVGPENAGEAIMASVKGGLIKVSSDNKFEKIQGLPDGEYHVAQIDPRDSKIIWAGLWLRGKNGSTLYVSKDKGSSWSPVEGGPQGSDINFVYFDPDNEDTYVGTYGAGLFRTTDDGKTWASMGSLPEDDITMMAFSADKKAIYVGTHSSGVLKSVDGGKSWVMTNEGKEAANDVHGLATDPKDANTVFAAGMMMGRGVFKSSDGARSWQPLDTGDINLEDVHIFQITPDEKSIILGSGEHGSGKGILYKLDLTN